MNTRINTAINGQDASGAEPRFELVERSSARVAQDYVEVGQTTRPDIRERFPGFELFERHWSVEVIESAHGRGRVEYEIRGRDTIGAIGGHNCGIGIAQMQLGRWQHIVPSRIR